MTRAERRQEIQKMLEDKIYTISRKYNKVKKNIKRIERKLKRCKSWQQRNYYLKQKSRAEINAEDLINKFLMAIEDERMAVVFNDAANLHLNIIDDLPE